MSNRKFITGVFVLIAAIVFSGGCYKSSTVFLGPAEVTKDVSFATDLLPIFETRCALSGCHNAGGQVPTLTPSRAYDALLEEDLINFETPESSELYDWLTGKLQPAMPFGGSDPDINALVLAWLKQGAKNN
jgi:hypothetical protein